jgi:glutamate dehydrogenase
MSHSTWRDYDVSAISEGGGIFDRSAKAIPLNPQTRALLNIQAENASGEDVIRRILAAQVDLLYNGGIGTYIKATAESHAEVGDRTNDRVRVDAAEIHARVVGEGGNLGFTQKGRIEYWMHGGLINTDALDNSAGVDTSDHEVNIKILLDLLVKKGVIHSKEERDRILLEMTEEVAALVLADNVGQSRSLTMDGLRSAARYDRFVNLVGEMTARGIVDRLNPHIPAREELLQSNQKARGLPRPLLADLLGYTKMWACDLVMHSEIPDSPEARPFLQDYFPRRLHRHFSVYFPEHPLRREIIATGVVNYVANNGGVALLPRLMDAARGSLAESIAAYLAADRDTSADSRRRGILEASLPAREEHEALLKVESALESAALNLLTG